MLLLGEVFLGIFTSSIYKFLIISCLIIFIPRSSVLGFWHLSIFKLMFIFSRFWCTAGLSHRQKGILFHNCSNRWSRCQDALSAGVLPSLFAKALNRCFKSERHTSFLFEINLSFCSSSLFICQKNKLSIYIKAVTVTPQTISDESLPLLLHCFFCFVVFISTYGKLKIKPRKQISSK